MDESVKSPLIRGKPAWHVRYFRAYWLFAISLVLLLVLQFAFLSIGIHEDILLAYNLLMLGWVFGFQIYMEFWFRRFGTSIFGLRSTLEKSRGVPCPNCLYPLCEIPEADTDHVCAECGCGISGVDAIHAWSQVKGRRWGYEIPKAWNRWLKSS